MEELQEATRQYLSCPDPVEAAARRQRVNIGDAKGEMEAAALSIIKAAEGKLASSYIVRTGDSNPVTPPPLHNGYPVTHPPLQEVCLQDLASSDCVVLHTPQDNGKGEGSSNQPLNEVIILRSPSTPLEKRAEPKKLKSIIISPPDATTGNNLTRDEPTPPVEVVQSPANVTLLEFQNRTRKRAPKTTRARTQRSSPNILRGASSKKRKLSQIQNSPRGRKKTLAGSSSRGQVKASGPPQAASSPASISNPPIQLIPPTSKRNSDFRFLPTQAP